MAARPGPLHRVVEGMGRGWEALGSDGPCPLRCPEQPAEPERNGWAFSAT